MILPNRLRIGMADNYTAVYGDCVRVNLSCRDDARRFYDLMPAASVETAVYHCVNGRWLYDSVQRSRRSPWIYWMGKLEDRTDYVEGLPVKTLEEIATLYNDPDTDWRLMGWEP